MAEAIDHEGAFQHTEWVLRDSLLWGIYARRTVYGQKPSSRSVRPMA
jgi:hypothetical protein